jgi:glycosyltransferase involved in cell wall biosynthesis
LRGYLNDQNKSVITFLKKIWKKERNTMDSPTLVILPALKVKKLSHDSIVLTQKFIDGIREYQKYWPGNLIVLIEEDPNLSNNLDNVAFNIQDLPFSIDVVDFDRIQQHTAFQEATIVLASEGFRQNKVSKICNQFHIPCIYVTENSFKTRIQIINAITQNPVLRLRKYGWQILQQRKLRRAIATAQGIQCNGVPTYQAYRAINAKPLLYFDTRITEDILASEAEVLARTSQCLALSPLRLLFSGRLIKIKGADHLILVAQELKKLKVEFELFICGEGELQGSMQAQIQQGGLSHCVKLLGTLDFKRELVPFAKKNIDLFLCCHRQGDPSCTYLETMSCGVPLVGYANEALVGVVDQSQAGWYQKMDRPDLLAQQIALLNQNRQLIVDESFKSLEFAKLHTFERTFARRITHLKELL